MSLDREPPTQYYPPVPPQPYAVAAKNPGVALVLSFFIPGLGSLYAGDIAWGIALILVNAFAWVLTLAIVGWILVPVIWVVGMIMGYTGARDWNLRHGIVS